MILVILVVGIFIRWTWWCFLPERRWCGSLWPLFLFQSPAFDDTGVFFFFFGRGGLPSTSDSTLFYSVEYDQLHHHHYQNRRRWQLSFFSFETTYHSGFRLHRYFSFALPSYLQLYFVAQAFQLPPLTLLTVKLSSFVRKPQQWMTSCVVLCYFVFCDNIMMWWCLLRISLLQSPIQTVNGNTLCHVYIHNTYLIVASHDLSIYVYCLKAQQFYLF